MFAAEHLPAFLAAAGAVLIVPGPSVAYAVARSVEHGRSAGLFAVLGLETGLLLHVLASAAGLAAILASSGSTLTAIKVAGAGFLAYLGVAEIRHASAVTLEASQPRPTATRLFHDAVLVDLLNPKTALFVLAFLPQFVEPGRGAVALQSLVLGLYLCGPGLPLRRHLRTARERPRRPAPGLGPIAYGAQSPHRLRLHLAGRLRPAHLRSVVAPSRQEEHGPTAYGSELATTKSLARSSTNGPICPWLTTRLAATPPSTRGPTQRPLAFAVSSSGPVLRQRAFDAATCRRPDGPARRMPTPVAVCPPSLAARQPKRPRPIRAPVSDSWSQVRKS